MKNGYIKTAAATPYITVADCNANGNEIIRLIHEMEKEHVKVMTFPELCITGYTCQDLFLQRRLLDSAWETLLKITKETADVDALVFVGVPFRNHGKLYNVAAVLNRGEIIGLVPKTYLPNYGEFYEQRHFASGLGCLEYVDIEGKRVPFGTDILFICEEEPELVAAAEICEDLWVTLPPSVLHAQAGANLIVNLSASNEMVGKLHDGHVKSCVGKIFSHLHANISTADNHRRFWMLFVYILLDLHSIGDIAQSKYLVTVDSINLRSNGRSTRRKNQAVVSLGVFFTCFQIFDRNDLVFGINGNRLAEYANVNIETSLKALGCLQSQIGFFGDLTADIIRKSAVGERNKLSALQYNNLGFFVKPSESCRAGRTACHASYDQGLHKLTSVFLSVNIFYHTFSVSAVTFVT